jgi:F0F1-type ATP synthase membrane subunit c/vacuolar-type H+-ATPase subunit K
MHRHGWRRHRCGPRGRQLPAGALRNPSAAGGQTATLFIGIAFAEALGIFSFLVALLLMFAV